MPMIGCEKLNKDDFKSVDKSQRGLLSVWNWLTKKDKCFDSRKNVSDNKKTMVNAMIQRLSAEDVHQLNAIDIQKLQNLNNSNKKKQPHINQVAKDKLYLKENGIRNECVMPNSVKKSKSVNNSKVDTNLLTSTSMYSKNAEENCINSNSPYIVDVKSHKSDVNNLIYKVGKKGNNKIISQSKLLHKSVQMESLPSKFLQDSTKQKELIPICYKQRKAKRFCKSNHVRQDNSNNQLNKTEDNKLITMELTKNKSIEDTEIKMNGTSKLKVLKLSPARHNLNNNYSPIHNETKKYVSCKIYSTNKNLSKSLRKVHRKITKKKSKYFQSSSSEQFSKTGYNFENFKDSLNNVSLDFSASISIEPIYDKATHFEKFPYSVTPPETIMNKNPLGGGYRKSSINIEINGVTFKSKDANSHSGVINSSTNQQQNITTHEIQKSQNNNLNSMLHNDSVPSYTGVNISELNNNNLNVIQSNAPLDTERCATEQIVGHDLLKSDNGLSKTGDQINNKPTLKNLLLQFNKETIQSCDVFHNDSCKGIFSDDRTRLKNHNNNVSKELTMPLSEEIKESPIKITILVEDNLKKLVDLKSNVATSNKKECTDTENFCNIHTRSLQTDEANRNESTLSEKEHYIIYDSCYPLQKVNNESTVKTCLGSKDQRIINEITNNKKVGSNITLNALKPKNCIEDHSLQYGNEGKYLYKKERKQLELFLTKENTYGVSDPLSKTYISKKHEEQSCSEIKDNWDIDYGIAETEVRVDNNLINSSQVNTTSDNANESIKTTFINPLSVLTDNETKTIDSIKGQQDFNDGKLEEKRFFRIIDKKEDESNPVDKCIITADTRKRSCRYGLTLSQEPTFEESEDGMSTKDMIYNEHQSVKGDNIEIKSTDCKCYNPNEMTMYEKDIVSPISAWLNRNDKISDYDPVKCIKTSSVLVQTDWSLIGKSVHCLNEIPNRTISCQTDSISNNIILFDNETTDNSDSYKYLTNNHSKLVSCDPITIDSEESKNTPSDNQTNLRITAVQQNGILPTLNGVKKVETKHQCTARCFYSVSQECRLASACQLGCTISTALQDHNFTLTKTEASGSTSSDHVPEISTIEEESGSRDDHLCDNFCEKAKREPEDNVIKVNDNVNPNKSKDCRTMSTLFVVDVPSDTNKRFLDKLDISIQKCYSKGPKTRAGSRQGKINILSDTDKIKQDLLFHTTNTSNICCVDCTGCVAFNKEYSSA